MADYRGTAFELTPNEIYETLANMIISQEVFADNLGKHQTLVDKARVDGGLFGDTKLYYATDVLSSHAWGDDAEAENLLELDRPEDPEVQAIKLDTFRQIRLTLDNYLTKRAFSTEGAFSSFNGVMLGWMKETKKVYDGTLYNVFIGTNVSSKAAQNIKIDLTDAATSEDRAKEIARGIADLVVAMGDYSRDFNDYGNLRSYADEAIKVVWNSKFVNEIKKIDLPTIFHKDGLVDKFDQDIMPSKYFGQVVDSTVAAADNEGGYRAVAEDDIEVASAAADPRAKLNKKDNKYYVHVFPGDEIPAGVAIAAGSAYVNDDTIICKVLVKLPPYMSAFEVGTTFFNPRSLTENHYLTFGHNSLVALKNYPFVTLIAKEADE